MRLQPILLILATAATPLLTAPARAAESCPAAREYIVALEFLRDSADLKVKESDARTLAAEVATGCAGASVRFIRVTRALLSAGLGGGDAARLGREFARKDDAAAAAFTTVFRYAFLEDYLDLDLRASIRMAVSLSKDFPGDSATAARDFERLVGFCAGDESLQLPKPVCGAFAARVAALGAAWARDGSPAGVSAPFLDLHRFLTAASNGPGLPLNQALSTAEELVALGPGAPENFITAFRYANSSRGLELGASESIAFARGLARVPGGGDTPESIRRLASPAAALSTPK